MSVLKGEGRFRILYGSTTIPAGRVLPGYVGRPDVRGSFPTVVILAPELTSHLKDLARRLARHGFATIVTGSPVGAAAAIDFADAPGTEWADSNRLAILGVGESGRDALRMASADDRVASVALIDGAVDTGWSGGVPAFGVYGASGDAAPTARALASSGVPFEAVLYGGLESGFFDESADAYDPVAASDAFDRIVGFLGDSIGVPVGA